jgi:predicted amino acid-binding ACT domain protein
MSIFGALVRTAVNVVTLPVAAVKDVFTLGGVATCKPESYTSEKLKQIKREAEP